MQSEITIDHGEHKDRKSRHDSDEGEVIELHARPKLPKASATPKHNQKHDKPAHHSTHSSSLPPMQMVVQLNVYREAFGRFEYLLLKRIDEDEAFWQVITEPVPDSSTLVDVLKDAASEQAGLHGVKHLSHDMYSYEWYAGGQRGRDIVFAAEVAADTPITIDRHHYEEYAWLPFDEAVQHLKWNGNKQALRQLHEHLRAKRLEMPATVTTGFYGNGSKRMMAPATGPAPDAVSATATAQAADDQRHNPYGDNVPKRLPDVKEDGLDELKPYPDEDDDNTGDWLL